MRAGPESLRLSDTLKALSVKETTGGEFRV